MSSNNIPKQLAGPSTNPPTNQSSNPPVNPQAINQNLYTLDKIATRMLNEFQRKNAILESGMRNCQMFESIVSK
jgi:hypothetical protein